MIVYSKLPLEKLHCYAIYQLLLFCGIILACIIYYLTGIYGLLFIVIFHGLCVLYRFFIYLVMKNKSKIISQKNL